MKVAVVGLGLIGGSLAMALKKAGHAVVGIDTDPETLELARAAGAVDLASDRLADLQGSAVAVVATPLSRLCGDVVQVLELALPGSVVTDTGSVKSAVVQAAKNARIQAGVAFVGGHPMFGTEGSGFAAASEKLVRGAPFLLTPGADVPPESVAALQGLWTGLGMSVRLLTPEEHDARLAALSHTPLLLGAALCLSSDDLSAAGPSFRDATRVALAEPELLMTILSLNGPAVRAAVAHLAEGLLALSQAEPAALEEKLREAQNRRKVLQQQLLKRQDHTP